MPATRPPHLLEPTMKREELRTVLPRCDSPPHTRSGRVPTRRDSEHRWLIGFSVFIGASIAASVFWLRL